MVPKKQQQQVIKCTPLFVQRHMEIGYGQNGDWEDNEDRLQAYNQWNLFPLNVVQYLLKLTIHFRKPIQNHRLVDSFANFYHTDY